MSATSDRPTLLLATGNAHKVQEIRRILEPFPLDLVDLTRYPGLPEAVESGATYLQNALLKALHYHRLTGDPCLADDSGLEVDALDGEPGLHSSRYAGADTPHSEKIRHLLARLEGLPPEQRTARFRCVAVLVGVTAEPMVAEGTCEGVIAAAPSGEGGFGYDPIFYLPERGCTMAELAEGAKNEISHRGRAMRALAGRLTGAPA